MEENITTKDIENKKYKLVADLLQYYNELNATIKRNYELKTFDFDILHIATKVKAYIFENDDLRKVFNDEISNYNEKCDKNFYDDYITKQRNFETEMLYKIGKPKFTKIKDVTYFEYLVLDDEKYEADDLLETYTGLFYYEYLLNKLPKDELSRLLDSYIFISNFTYQLSNKYNYELYEELGPKGCIEVYPEIDFYTLFQITSKSMYDEFYFCEGILLYVAAKNVLKILIDYLNSGEDIENIEENVNNKLSKELTFRELQIENLLKQRKTPEEIAIKFNISNSTVRAHIGHIAEKRNLKGKKDLDIYYWQNK